MRNSIDRISVWCTLHATKDFYVRLLTRTPSLNHEEWNEDGVWRKTTEKKKQNVIKAGRFYRSDQIVSACVTHFVHILFSILLFHCANPFILIDREVVKFFSSCRWQANKQFFESINNRQRTSEQQQQQTTHLLTTATPLLMMMHRATCVHVRDSTAT